MPIINYINQMIQLPQIEISRIIQESKKFVRENNQETSSKTYKDFQKLMGWIASDNLPFMVWKEWYLLYKKDPKSFQNKLNKMLGQRRYLGEILFEAKDKISRKRLELVKDAFEAHYKKKYHLSILLLTPQVEGLTWELAQKRKIISPPYNSKMYTSTNNEADLYCIAKTIFGKEVNKAIFFEIFQDGFRNEILHGRNYHKNEARHINRRNSVKLILAIYRIVLDF